MLGFILLFACQKPTEIERFEPFMPEKWEEEYLPYKELKQTERIQINDYAVVKVYSYRGEPVTGRAYNEARYGHVLYDFQDGKIHGDVYSWYKSGEPKGHSTYEEGMVLINRVWFDNGQQRWEHHKRQGYRVGVHRTWSEDGVMILWEEYSGEKGEERLQKTWYRNGNAKSSGRFVLDSSKRHPSLIKDGVWELWDEEGSKKTIEHWVSGTLVLTETEEVKNKSSCCRKKRKKDSPDDSSLKLVIDSAL